MRRLWCPCNGVRALGERGAFAEVPSFASGTALTPTPPSQPLPRLSPCRRVQHARRAARRASGRARLTRGTARADFRQDADGQDHHPGGRVERHHRQRQGQDSGQGGCVPRGARAARRPRAWRASVRAPARNSWRVATGPARPDLGSRRVLSVRRGVSSRRRAQTARRAASRRRRARRTRQTPGPHQWGARRAACALPPRRFGARPRTTPRARRAALGAAACGARLAVPRQTPGARGPRRLRPSAPLTPRSGEPRARCAV